MTILRALILPRLPGVAVILVAVILTGAFAQSESGRSVQLITLADLKKEAASTPAPVAALFRFLAAPADKVVLANGKELWVTPLPQFLGSRPVVADALDVTVVAGEETGNKKQISGADVASVSPFEQFALAKIADFLGKNARDDLPALTKLQAAEKGLQALAWFHDGTRTYGAVGVSPWNELRDRVHRELKSVRTRQLTLLAEAVKKDNSWKSVSAFADRLAAIYPDDNVVGHQLRSFWTDYGFMLIAQGDYTLARKLMTRMEQQYVRHPEAKSLEDKLRERAGQLAKQAETAPDAEAQEKLVEALSVWPRLPGVRDALLVRRKQHAVLYVGVRRLPEWLSPATAWTDAEKQAVDLLFEPLVEPWRHPEVGQRFEARLARRLPDVEPLHRRVQLRPDAYWSDGRRVTSSDVRHCVQLLRDSEPALRDLMQIPRVEQESFNVDLEFEQGYLDPLALLSFRVLPQSYGGKTLLRADDLEFARKPVGSGPYQYSGRADGGKTVVFTSNPHYVRAQPAVREIRLFAWQDPVRDLDTATARSALLLDVPTEQLAAFKGRGAGLAHTALERRVYFLAVNHRVAALGNADLRRALAHAIDRERILDDYFRGGIPDWRLLEALAPAAALPLASLAEKHPEFHHALNGLYPVDSWAHCPPPRVPARLRDAGRARTLFRALQKLTPLKLTLKYPDDDPRIAGACRAIAEQVKRLAAEAGVTIDLQPTAVDPHLLKKSVADHEYELAYYCLDYDNESYWLWPLFDPQPDALRKGGTNFLGYENDGKLLSLFRAAMNHRYFPTVRDRTHAIHAHLIQVMPVIPLWQLHRHMIVPAHVDPGHVEPLHIFRHLAEWKVSVP
jgi:ABC-type oligopeptide transport system substrate-binding subunit